MKQIAFAVAMALVLSFGNAHVGASVTCPGDISDNTQAGENFDVNVFDLLLLLSGWNNDAPGAEIAAPDDVVDVFDLLALLQNWGPCLIVPGDVCAEDDESGGAHCQLSDLTGQGATGTIAVFSDPDANNIVVDNFVIQTAGPLTSICWYGVYYDPTDGSDCSINVTDDFSIRLFLADASGLPSSASLASYQVGAMTLGVDKIYTGDQFGSNNRYAVFEYTFDLPAGQLPGGLQADTCYWVEISNDASSPCYWAWLTTPPGDGRTMYRLPSNPTYVAQNQRDFDLAWCLDQAVADVLKTCPFPPVPSRIFEPKNPMESMGSEVSNHNES